MHNRSRAGRRWCSGALRLNPRDFYLPTGGPWIIGDIRKRIGARDGYRALVRACPAYFHRFRHARDYRGDYVCACVSSAQLRPTTLAIAPRADSEATDSRCLRARARVSKRSGRGGMRDRCPLSRAWPAESHRLSPAPAAAPARSQLSVGKSSNRKRLIHADCYRSSGN